MKKKIIYLALAASALLILAGCSRKNTSHNKNNVKVTTATKKNNPPDKIATKIKHMSLDEKIGQLYFVHSNGNFSEMKNSVEKYQLGGIALFGPDYQNRSKNTFSQQIKAYQKASNTGLFIGTDQEGGTVSRINVNRKISNRDFPSPQEIYNRDGLVGIKKEEQNVAKILRRNGINMNFAPVADVAKNKNSFIFKRTLGQNYSVTAKYIPVTVKAMQRQKVAATLKHFPGYGDADDTHTGFAQINKSFAAYKNEDLLPFKAGIKAGANGVMISHIIIKNLDSTYPASLSPAVHQLLRQKMHYQGLIITDDLQMGAITQFAKKHNVNADVLALEAGNDVLLGGDPETGIPAIKKAVANKQISEKQINQSVYRILKLKQELAILK